MKLCETVTAYRPRTSKIRVGLLKAIQDGNDWTGDLPVTIGAVFTEVTEMHGEIARQRVMAGFIGVTVRDGVDIEAAQRAFLKIDEYVEAIPYDMIPQNS